MSTSLAEKFNAQAWASRLLRRKDNFLKMLEHFDHFKSDTHIQRPIIIETGTAWDRGNFEGQGQSSLIWDWYASTCYEAPRVISIDIRAEASEHAKEFTRFVEYIVGDSVKGLAELHEYHGDIALLYLDSFDWTPELNMDSSFHHLLELTAVWAKLPSGCLVVVDDRHGDMKGKHWMVEAFMNKLGIKPLFKNHQMGWVKP